MTQTCANSRWFSLATSFRATVNSIICVTWLIHMRDMTPSYVWRDSFICVTWLIHVFIFGNELSCYCSVWHDSFIWVTRLIQTCDVTHKKCDMSRSCYYCYVWLDAFIRVTRLIHMRTPGGALWQHELSCYCNAWYDSFMWVTWLIHVSNMTYSYADARYRVAKTHRMPWFAGLLSQKSHQL